MVTALLVALVAIDVDRGMLWTLAEHPWRRLVRGIPLADVGLGGIGGSGPGRDRGRR